VKKPIIFTSLLVISIVLINAFVMINHQLPISSINVGDSREELMEDALLSRLFPTIDQAITNHYGKRKQFMKPKVLEIKRLETAQFHFEVILEVITFEGPHNPPYGTDTITIIMAGQLRVENFNHIDGLQTKQR
jgi:hypothetical protein